MDHVAKSMTYTTRILDAVALAFELHSKQKRKLSGVPYISHLMAVAATVGDHGGDEDQFVAALLHDAAEDQGGHDTLARIRERFGEAVARYVEGCTDAFTVPKPPWRGRKEDFLKRLEDADARVKLVVAADKLHNARATVTALRQHGEAIWGEFRGGRDDTLWYYAEVLRALAKGWSHPVLRELADAVDALHREAHAAGQEV